MKVLLIDDHPMLNAGIASMLESTGFFRVYGQAESLAQAMSIIEESEDLPSIIILDLLLGEENGLDFFPMLEKYCADKQTAKPPVLICSALVDSFNIQSAFKLGAAGFLSKAGGKAELLNAINAILCGKVYVSDELNIKLTEENQCLYAKFTKQEIRVIDLIKANKTNQEIANELDINIRTVANYTNKIYLKTGLSSREEVRRL